MKKILLFHSKTAGGHYKSAQALAEELKALDKNQEIVIKDALEETNVGLKVNPSISYRILTGKLLPLYNILYFLTNTGLGVKILRLFIKLSWGKQFKRLIEEENPDFILSTHHFISPSTIYKLQKKYPFITVVTDFIKPHRIWFDKKIDVIIVPNKKTQEYAKKIINDNKKQIIVLGFPIARAFKASLNNKLSNTIMVVGGGSGTGRLEEQVNVLQKEFPDKKLIVICGFNHGLFNKLSQIKNEQLRVYQFVENLHALMRESDIIISKAGPGTIMEAASLRKPLIITDWIGLQEKDNVNFVVDNKLGIFCPNLRQLPKSIQDMYQNYSKYSSNKTDWGSAKQIAEYLNKNFFHFDNHP